MQLATDGDRQTCEFGIVYDTREQRPWTFQGIQAGKGSRKLLSIQLVRKCLRAGDYSIAGFESRVCIERKSVADAVSTIIRGRERFRRELQRMADYESSHVIVEGDLSNILKQMPELTRAPKSALFRSIASFSIEFPKTHWHFMPNRTVAERFAFRLLSKFYRTR